MEKHYKKLLEMIPAERILFNEQLREGLHYALDRSKRWQPNPSMVLFPKNTLEVQKIVQYCFENELPLVPSGGRTGYAGGALARDGEIVISMEKMNQILSFDPTFGTITLQAGVITENINAHVKESGLFFPVQFAATGSTHIGGNLSTNAGGHRVIRYGNTRQWILGVKMVDGQGEILDLGGEVIKDVSGYDLKQLAIGAEGTLGLITEVTLRLCKLPAMSFVFLLALASYENLLKLFTLARALPLPVFAFEFFTLSCLEKVLEDAADLKPPFDNPFPFYVLLELEDIFSGNCDSKVSKQILENFLEELIGNEVAEEGVLAQNSAQAKTLWKYREQISEALSLKHTVHKNDISIPLSHIREFTEKLEHFLTEKYPDFQIAIFGHIGDGNLHINIIKPEKLPDRDFFETTADMDHILFQLVAEYQGSISAEHGIGLLKKQFLKYNHSARELEIQKKLKKIFDPKNIFNRGKIFDI